MKRPKDSRWAPGYDPREQGVKFYLLYRWERVKLAVKDWYKFTKEARNGNDHNRAGR